MSVVCKLWRITKCTLNRGAQGLLVILFRFVRSWNCTPETWRGFPGSNCTCWSTVSILDLYTKMVLKCGLVWRRGCRTRVAFSSTHFFIISLAESNARTALLNSRPQMWSRFSFSTDSTRHNEFFANVFWLHCMFDMIHSCTCVGHLLVWHLVLTELFRFARMASREIYRYLLLCGGLKSPVFLKPLSVKGKTREREKKKLLDECCDQCGFVQFKADKM